MSELVEVKHLGKRYGRREALADVSFSLPGGRIVGLLGPNGSGKTTLIKILAGLLGGWQGEALIGGRAPGVETKAMVAYLPDKTYFSNWMRVRDCMSLFADFYADFDAKKAAGMLERLGIDPGLRVTKLSKGTYEKVQLAAVMSRRARLYLLDEPLGGVDPAARDVILDTILKNYCEESTILLSTQLISDVERVFDSVVILKAGRLYLSEEVDALRARTGQSVDELFREVFKC